MKSWTMHTSICVGDVIDFLLSLDKSMAFETLLIPIHAFLSIYDELVVRFIYLDVEIRSWIGVGDE